MITYINKDNAAAYQALFQKAETLLKTKRPASLGIDINDDSSWENLKIGSLNEYFGYLETILKLFEDEEDPDKKLNKQAAFIRLPLDENAFAIDADTRSITVPSSFSRYGVGVQGDASAETVYFTIDRYFDAMDLARDDIKIAIQWETKDKNRNTIVGISKIFGKEIINVQEKDIAKTKIIFGWPIASKLTQTADPIKFAVRFYRINDNTIEYSLTTLPSEITVNATLNYNLLDNSIDEIDVGKILINRIKSSGIHDEDAEIPEVPTITTNLYALSAATDRIVDLPNDNSGIQLAISAQPTTIGVISYLWKKYKYNETKSDYSAGEVELPNSEDTVAREFIEITADISVDDNSYFYNENEELISDLGSILESNNGFFRYDSENEGFKKNSSDTYMKVFKDYSVATVHSVGEYAVTVTARAGINSVTTTSSKITIPGPLKPEVQYSSDANITNDVVHIIAENGKAVLTVDAITGESQKSADQVGSNPQVDLAFDWLRAGSETPIGETATAGDMTVSVVSADEVFKNNAELRELSQFNQNHVGIIQDGNTITIYKTAELNAFESTDESQAGTDHEWVALDIDTKSSDITDFTWEGNELSSFDVDDAASVGLGDGHIVFWIKMDDPRESVTIANIGTDESVQLFFNVVNYNPALLTYGFNENKNVMTIQGLPAENLDSLYYAKVTASRNNVTTSQNSINYRITNKPEKPIIKYREYNGNVFVYVEKDYSNTPSALPITLINQRTGQYNKISFAVEPPAQSDELSYIWMRINANPDLDSDWIAQDVAKLQVDVDDALPDLFADNIPGAADNPVTGIFNLTVLRDLGQVVNNEEENGPVLQLGQNTPSGYYYCIVVNELNNNRVANVTPFFYVS